MELYDRHETPVMFRTYPNGLVTAFFPTLSAHETKPGLCLEVRISPTLGFIESARDYSTVVGQSYIATDEEAEPLKAPLRTFYGFTLRTVASREGLHLYRTTTKEANQCDSITA